MTLNILIVIAVLCPTLSFAGTKIENLEAQYKQNISTEYGKKYYHSAIKYLFTNANFMKECAPPNGPLVDGFTFYISVSKSGKVKDVTVVPENKAALCFKKHVSKKIFPKPKTEFIVKEKFIFY